MASMGFFEWMVKLCYALFMCCMIANRLTDSMTSSLNERFEGSRLNTVEGDTCQLVVAECEVEVLERVSQPPPHIDGQRESEEK